MKEGEVFMYIRKTRSGDIDVIMKMYEQAKKFMQANGNPNQWGKEYPGVSLIKKDIESGNSFVAIEGTEIVGTFYFVVGEDPTYAKIYEGEWMNDDPYGVVHRITSANGKRGVATFCLDWCLNECKNIRIDTHRRNVPMQNLLKKNGYKQCGIIYLANGDDRIAYQKSVRGEFNYEHK
jgi:RimJ/RimL family protein N-acetyltransferase